MKIAFIVFTDLTLLDFIGVYDPVSSLKSMGYIDDLDWDICAFEQDVEDQHGFILVPDKIQPDLSEYDMLVVPGGKGTRELMLDSDFIAWLSTASKVKYKCSVCTGSLLLGAAGFLVDKRATTNFNSYHLLEKYANEIVTNKVVHDGDVITAGAVSSALDLGLYIVKLLAGEDALFSISNKMDYRKYELS